MHWNSSSWLICTTDRGRPSSFTGWIWARINERVHGGSSALDRFRLPLHGQPSIFCHWVCSGEKKPNLSVAQQTGQAEREQNGSLTSFWGLSRGNRNHDWIAHSEIDLFPDMVYSVYTCMLQKRTVGIPQVNVDSRGFVVTSYSIWEIESNPIQWKARDPHHSIEK